MRAEEFILSNGLKVVHLHLPEAQQYSLSLDVPVGAIHDPIGKEGLSHILEHTVFSGSQETSEKDLMRLIKAAGGGYGAYTSCDETVFEIWSSSFNPENFGIIADILRQFITEPTFDPDRLKLELGVIVNELGDSIDNVSRSTTESLYNSLYKGRSPATNIIGTPDSILGVKPEDLRDFIKKHYDSGQMTLFVAGPLSAKDAEVVLDGTLSAIPNLGQDKLPRFDMEFGTANVRDVREDLRQNNTVFMFGYDCPQNIRDYAIDTYAKIFINNTFSEELRRRYGCFYRAEFSGWVGSKDKGISYISASHRPEDSKNIAIGISDFYQDIKSFMTDDVIQARIDNEKFYLSKTNQIDVSILGLVKRKFQIDGDLLDIEEYRRTLDTIKPFEVRERVLEILDGFCGVAVKGPNPMAMPDFDTIRKSFGNHHDLIQVTKPTIAGPSYVIS